MATPSTASSSTDGGEPHAGAPEGTPAGSSQALPTPPATGVVEPAAPAPDHDVGRRAFFRAFSRQALVTVGQVAGVADAVTRGTTGIAANLVGLGLGDPTANAGRLGSSAPTAPARRAALARPSASTTPASPEEGGYRSPFRVVDDVLYLLDQRGLPDRIEEQACRRASDVAFYLRVGAARGGPLMAQLAAYGLALTAREFAPRTYRQRVAEYRRVDRAIVAARPGSRMLRWALGRMRQVWEGFDPDAPGEDVAIALRAQADAITMDAQLDHAAIGKTLAGLLPRPEGRALQVLVHGAPGVLTGGHVGTALGALALLAGEGRPVKAWVTETRPYLDGARLATWELAQHSIDHVTLPDSAVAYLLSHEAIDAVLMGAEWVAGNGDAANVIGSRAVAELAAVAGRDGAVPVILAAPATTIDPDVADGAAIPAELRPGRDLDTYQAGFHAHRVSALNPAMDVIPAARISRLVTEEGVLDPTDLAALAAAAAAREARRPTLPPRSPALDAPLPGAGSARDRAAGGAANPVDEHDEAGD